MAEPTRNPLQWPPGWKRTERGFRQVGRFATTTDRGGYRRPTDISIAQAMQRLQLELERMGVRTETIVLSSNLQLNLDGSPRSAQAQPADPGVAVYWKDGKRERCMAIDAYTKVEQNIAALAAVIEAMRAIERHGGPVILDRAFTGFAALPAPIIASQKRDWQAVLELKDLLQPTVADVERAFRRLTQLRHPDKPGGSHAKMAELNVARDEALEELKP